MAKQRRSVHAALDELRQAAADERMKQRELEAALEAAKLEVEQASAAIAAGYAAEDERAVVHARKTEEEAVAKVRELHHRLTGAELRVERAQQELDTFSREHAGDLLAEREQPARTVAAELSRSVAETLTLAKAYIAERQAIDRLVAEVPGATPRADGPAPEHPWEQALKTLERCYQHTPELQPPLPRWAGLEHRQQQDDAAHSLREAA